MNCALYARVSTDKQADKELSLPAQLQAMRNYAQQRGWTVCGEFVERGVSAKTAERAELQKLLAAVRDSEGNLEVVLVHKIDRLARNVFDHATIRALLKQRGVRLASVVENVDDSVPGQLVENIMASIAEFYSGNLSEEVKKGLKQKVMGGGWPHRPPRGYTTSRALGERSSRVVPHPTDAPLVRQAFELYATGWHSLKAVAERLRRDGMATAGGRPLAPATIQRLLTNTFYIGRIHWKGVERAGTHEPIVTAAMFERVQSLLRERGRQPVRGRADAFPLRGVAICASCRGHMTAAFYKRRFGYYSCSRRTYDRASCGAKGYTRADVAHRGVERALSRLALSADDCESILDAARQLLNRQAQDVTQRRRALTARRSVLAGRELRLTEAFVAGEVEPEAYKGAASRLRTEMADVERGLAATEYNPEHVLHDIASTLSTARSVGDVFSRVSPTRQAEMLRAVFTSVVLDEGGLIGFSLRSPFDAIFSSRPDGHGANSAATKLAEYASGRISDQASRHEGIGAAAA